MTLAHPNARPVVTRALDHLAAAELTPEEFLVAVRYLGTRVRWPAGHHWQLVPDDTPAYATLEAHVERLLDRVGELERRLGPRPQ